MRKSKPSTGPQVSCEHVAAPFVGREQMTNRELFDEIADSLGVPDEVRDERAPVGRSGARHNLFERRVRWHQQSLRRMGVLERVDRGVWRLSAQARAESTVAPRKVVLLAFSTDLGCALWGNAEDVFGGLGEQITLSFASPPYPLTKQRAYGNACEAEYVDWLVPILEPIVKHLRPGGNLVLNLGNDIFVQGSPARSLYIERLTLALHSRLGLALMDRFVWVGNKPPGPVQWASIKRVHHNASYEHVLWFTNDPMNVIADNRRCLRPHSPEHLKLMRAGGERRQATYAGGAYTLRRGSFGKETAGAIARNVLEIPHRDADQRPARAFAAAHGLPPHPAQMPLKLAEHFVRFLSDVGDLVVDPFGGGATTGRAAELNDRRWLVTERCREYLMAAAERFKGARGFTRAWEPTEGELHSAQQGM